MRIAIDFDGTIANTYVLQQRFCRERFGINLPLEASVGALRKQYLTDEQIKEAKEFIHGEATLTTPLVDGAREAIQQLIAAGHRVVILTGRVAAGARTAKEYLTRNRVPYHRFLFVSDDEKRRLADGTILSKSVVINRLKLDIMVDDQLKGLSTLASNGITIILIDQPWNRQEKLPPGVFRMRGWPQIIGRLMMSAAV